MCGQPSGVAARSGASRRLGTLDRIVYGNQETVPVLAAAAAVTEDATSMPSSPSCGVSGRSSPEDMRDLSARPREGQPRLAAIAYASLGDDAAWHAQRYLGDYYSFTGDFAEQIAAGALTSAQGIADAVTFTNNGKDAGHVHGRRTRLPGRTAARAAGAWLRRQRSLSRCGPLRCAVHGRIADENRGLEAVR